MVSNLTRKSPSPHKLPAGSQHSPHSSWLVSPLLLQCLGVPCPRPFTLALPILSSLSEAFPDTAHCTQFSFLPQLSSSPQCLSFSNMPATSLVPLIYGLHPLLTPMEAPPEMFVFSSLMLPSHRAGARSEVTAGVQFDSRWEVKLCRKLGRKK